MYRIYGYCYGERFEMLTSCEGCLSRILEVPGVVLWGVDYVE